MKTLTKFAVIAAAIAFLVPFTSQNVRAEGKHPAYLHALSDLRDARAHLQRPDGGLKSTAPLTKSSVPHSTTERTLQTALQLTSTTPGSDACMMPASFWTRLITISRKKKIIPKRVDCEIA
jgi:hypothetical protein